MLPAASLIDFVRSWKARKSALVMPSGGSSAQGDSSGSFCDGRDGIGEYSHDCPEPFFFGFPLFGVCLVICRFFDVPRIGE